MNVAFSKSSLDDLTEIGEHIARSDPRRADAFTAELVIAAEAIAKMPQGFPLVPRDEKRELRRKRYRRYLIFYIARQEVVEIVRILHGARDYERVLFPDDEQP